jgi:hypothetical protein
MATLSRSLLIIAFRVMLFVGLFVLSVRFVHTYPLPMPPEHQHQLFVLSQKLGVRDPENLYLFAEVIVNLIAAAVGYMLLMRLWRKAKIKRRRCAVKSR